MNSKNWLDDNYYTILGITKSANEKDINKAFRQRSKESHPDKYPLGSIQREEAEVRFKKLNKIRDILLDPYKREEYDKKLQEIQDVHLNFIATNYHIKNIKDNFIKTPKIKFKDKLKESLKKQERSDYIFDSDSGVYQSKKDLAKQDYLNKVEKSKEYKRNGAKMYYTIGMQAFGRNDFRKAWVSFQTAKHLDPNIKIPLNVWNRVLNERK